jgi:hypothetical protein
MPFDSPFILTVHRAKSDPLDLHFTTATEMRQFLQRLRGDGSVTRCTIGEAIAWKPGATWRVWS